MRPIVLREFHGFLRRRVRIVEAYLNDDAHPGVLDTLESQWAWTRQLMKIKAFFSRRPLHHVHWDWRNKRSERGEQAFRFVTIDFHGFLQGVMAVDRKEGRSRQSDRPLLTIDYLETAPWNQTSLPLLTQYGGVGSSLISQAILLSQQLGFEGRIGLHSLPDAEGFYRKLGFSFLGYDRAFQGLACFEYDGEKRNSP